MEKDESGEDKHFFSICMSEINYFVKAWKISLTLNGKITNVIPRKLNHFV